MSTALLKSLLICSYSLQVSNPTPWSFSENSHQQINSPTHNFCTWATEEAIKFEEEKALGILYEEKEHKLGATSAFSSDSNQCVLYLVRCFFPLVFKLFLSTDSFSVAYKPIQAPRSSYTKTVLPLNAKCSNRSSILFPLPLVTQILLQLYYICNLHFFSTYPLFFN